MPHKDPEEKRAYHSTYAQINRTRIRANQKRWAQENPEKVKASRARHAMTHAEQIKAKNRRWEKNNPEKVQAKRKRHYDRNPEKARARSRQTYWQDPGKANAVRTKWAKKHPEKIRQHTQTRLLKLKAERQANPAKARAKDALIREKRHEAILASNRRYASKNSAKIVIKTRLYRQTHPEKVHQFKAARRAREKQAARIDLTAAQWTLIKTHFGYRCVYCPPGCKACKDQTHKLTQDHIAPIGPDGPHTLWNVVPACISCNSKKGNRQVLKPVQPLLL